MKTTRKRERERRKRKRERERERERERKREGTKIIFRLPLGAEQLLFLKSNLKLLFKAKKVLFSIAALPEGQTVLSRLGHQFGDQEMKTVVKALSSHVMSEKNIVVGFSEMGRLL